MDNVDYSKDNKEKIEKVKQMFKMPNDEQNKERCDSDLLKALDKRASIILFFGLVVAILSFWQISNLLNYIRTYIVGNEMCTECGVSEFFIGIICLVPATIIAIIISILLIKDRKKLKTTEGSINNTKVSKNVRTKHLIALLAIGFYLVSIIFTIVFFLN